MTSLIISDVRKAYGSTPVLHGIDLQVKPGSLVAILGASGVGKTTLLRIIAGFEAAGSGSVTIDGTVVDDGRHRTPPQRRKIGYVPQDGALFPHLTVQGNVAFALPRKERRGAAAREIMDMVGLTSLKDQYPHQLSGGQQQRVALGRALASRPSLVLLDEPFSSLDASLRAAVRNEVLRVLRATGTTTVLVTHDQDEALSSADRIAVMRDGRITQEGTPREIYQSPADPQTAAFVGTANLLDGTCDGDGVTTALGRHHLHPAQSVPTPGRVTVLIRPEQLSLSPARPGALTARVASCRYYGHDALLTIHPELPGELRELLGEVSELRARTDGPDSPEPGELVSLDVRGSVAAWPAPSA
ncbi:MAG TPA: ABC transporter ATP-binding protein [Streptosporangiaceae bacterium]|jgi:iron(III) transport system ATP-binding protein